MVGRHWWHLSSLLVVILLSISGLWLFYVGFFLQRVELREISSCDDQGLPCRNVQPAFQRAVLIVVDALRYDFMKYDTKLRHQDRKPFQNRIPIVHQLTQNVPEKAALFRFIADPPTTTMQRLKGLVTGSLPTFIDLSSNFAAAEIQEDNIISKLRHLERNITFMGDDTWLSLFPTSFQTSHPYPSFDVKDLDTVDRGVERHLIKELKNGDWSLLIAHNLGVDHCGHRYGPDHPEMARKLNEVNEMIRALVENLPDDSVLFVMGDHGMTRDGDHGGDSRDEVEAGLFVYSHKPFMPRHGKVEEVSQVDFVPTFSLLLGLPIPFSNLGMVIPSLFPTLKPTKGLSLVEALEINSHQVFGFLRTYKQISNDISDEVFQHLQHLYHLASAESTPERWSAFLRQALISCRDIWAKFDFRRMALGIVLIGASLLSLLIMLVLPIGLSWLKDPQILLGVSLSVFHFLSMFSNSFQVQEDVTVMWILISMIAVFFFRTYQRIRLVYLFTFLCLLLCITIRSMDMFRRCREEQWQCSAGMFAASSKESSSSSAIYRMFQLSSRFILPVVFFLFVTRGLWDKMKTKDGSFGIVLRSALFVGVLLDVARFFLTESTSILMFISFVVFLIVLFVSPSFLSVTNHSTPKTVNGIYKDLKKIWDQPNGELGDLEHHGLEEFFGISSLLFVLPFAVIVTVVLADMWALVTAFLYLLTAYIVVAFHRCSLPVAVIMWSFLAWQTFFSTGHQTAFPTLHWVLPESVGLHPDSNFVLRGVMMILETFPGHVISAVSLPLFVLKMEMENDVYWLKEQQVFFRRIWRAAVGYLLWNCSKLFIVTLNAAVNRRHLMVWKIFAPRFIFEGAAFVVTVVFLLISYCFSLRIFLLASEHVRRYEVPLDEYFQERRTKEAESKGSRRKRL